MTYAEELREGRRTGTYKFIPDENSVKNINDIMEKLKKEAKKNNKKDKRLVNVYLAYDNYKKEWMLLSAKKKISPSLSKLNVYENEVQIDYYKNNITRQLKDLGFSRVSVKVTRPNLYDYLGFFQKPSLFSLLSQKLFKKAPLYKVRKDTTLKIKFSW